MDAAMKITKFGEDNHLTWFGDIEQVLKIKDCWEAVEGDPPTAIPLQLAAPGGRPTKADLMLTLDTAETTAEAKVIIRKQLRALEWRRKDEVAKALMHLHVKTTYHATFGLVDTARGVRLQLQLAFRSRGLARAMDMRRKLASIRKEAAKGMTEYINRGSMICYEMRLLGQVPQNIDLVAAALAGLPDQYDTTGTAGADGAHVAERRHGAAHRGEGEAEADGAGIRAGAGGARGRDDGRRPAGLSAAATTANRRTRGQTAVLRLWPHRPYPTRLPHQLLPAPAQRRLPRGCAGRATRVDSSSRGRGTTIRGPTPRVGLSRPPPEP